MNATVNPTYASQSSTKRLWVAIGVLGAAMLAMGGALVYQQARPTASRIAPLAAVVAVPSDTAPRAQVAMQQDESEKPVLDKPVAAPAKKAPAAARSPASKNDRAGASSSASGLQNQGPRGNAPVVAAEPTAQPVRSVCSNCGTVESTTAVQREGAGTGLGAVAGGVLGAVVGNQVGGGNGRTAATVLGALGGGWAGNTVEKKMKKETLYQVRVRMEDGTRRTLEVATPVSAGSRVTVEGGSLRLADGSMASPLPPRHQQQQRQPQQTQSNTGPVLTGG